MLKRSARGLPAGRELCHHRPPPIDARLRADSQRDQILMIKLRSLLAALAVSLPLWALCACDRYADIKAELGPADLARFKRGVRLATPCWECHDITGTGVNVGPHLSELYGRQIGSLQSYGYSPGFREARWSWDARSLDIYLANPQGSMPGTTMVSPGMTDPRQRADLLFFLKHATRKR